MDDRTYARTIPLRSPLTRAECLALAARVTHARRCGGISCASETRKMHGPDEWRQPEMPADVRRLYAELDACTDQRERWDILDALERRQG